MIWEELPAVTFQSTDGNRARISSVPNAGFSWARAATVVPARIVSSSRTSRPSGRRTGTISAPNHPSSAARAARAWERAL